MIDDFEVLTEAFATDCQASLQDQLCLAQRQRIAFDRIRMIDPFNHQLFL